MFSKGGTVISTGDFNVHLFDMERYLNMLPNFSSEDDIIQFIKQSFPKLPGLILTTQVGLGRFYQTAV